jgi:hypothetical protein
MIQKTRFVPSDFAGAVDRLNRLLNACNRITQDLADSPADLNDDEAPRVVTSFRSVLDAFSIPFKIYFDPVTGFSLSHVKRLTRTTQKWSAGKLTRQEVVDLFDDVAEEADLDWCYAFAGISIKRLSPDEQHELFETVLKFGVRTC